MTKNGQDNPFKLSDEEQKRVESFIRSELDIIAAKLELVPEGDDNFRIQQPELPPVAYLKLVEAEILILQEGSLEEVQASLEKLYTQFPENMAIRLVYAKSLLSIDPEEVEEARYLVLFEKAISLLGINMNAVLGKLDELGYETPEDVRIVGKYEENLPFLASLDLLGEQQEIMGNYDQAIQLATLQLNFDPDDVFFIRNRLVDCFLICNEPGMVLEFCQFYKWDDGPTILYGKALALHMTNDAKAHVALQKAIIKHPHYAYEIADMEAPETLEDDEDFDFDQAEFLHDLWNEVEGAINFLKKGLRKRK
ncbi:MAG: hypothetical protein J0L94_09840 [Rhodothermia bacterium]|nr:hypothetical protein [Rhodothermia bacterium]